MIPTPKPLEALLQHLIGHGIRPVIVGGYVRDVLMGRKSSKDIDIELYHLEGLEALKSVLAPFGSAHEAGRSFGVIKLAFKGYDIDFSLPRTENKNGPGHKGFEVHTYQDISFEAAARRRDFTINAMGFDVKSASLYDPFNGRKDLDLKLLRCVDAKTFVDDPLRLFRAMQFAARFDFTCNDELIALCRGMYHSGELTTLPKERIFDEFKKMLLQSTQPSIGFRLLQEMQTLRMFSLLHKCSLKHNIWQATLDALDALSHDTNSTLTQRFAMLLSIATDKQDVMLLLEQFSDEKRFVSDVLSLYQGLLALPTFDVKSDEAIRRLALHVNITALTGIGKYHYNDAIQSVSKTLRERADALHVSQAPLPPLLQGRDLIALGFKPSEQFKTLLDSCYEAQLKGEIENRQEALQQVQRLYQNTFTS